MNDAHGVTDKRYFRGTISASRNGLSPGGGRVCNGDYDWAPPFDANVCHWCREDFAPNQMRFPIRTSAGGTSWPYHLVSVCMDCFKSPNCTDSERTNLERLRRECGGCGAPMITPLPYVFRWQVCSRRCYQRAHRQSKHEYKKCEVCKKHFKPVRHDARFCSNAHRQRSYRRRRAAS